MSPSTKALVGDLGATNARFGLVDLAAANLSAQQVLTLRSGDYADPAAAIDDYLSRCKPDVRPGVAVLACAGPVIDDAVRFTNHRWRVSIADLRALGFAKARLLNDFEALAHAAAQLRADDVETLGGPRHGQTNGHLAVMGPGTGFGLSILARAGQSSIALATEGGNVAFAPNDALEVDILRVLGARHGRVVVETILSGPGLLNLYDALCVIHDASPVATTPAQVTGLARQGERLAALAVQRFCAILGSVAGDVAISTGARGGIFITGGVADSLAPELRRGEFRSRFDDKGRYRDYVAAIPTARITLPQPALLGAAAVAQSMR